MGVHAFPCFFPCFFHSNPSRENCPHCSGSMEKRRTIRPCFSARVSKQLEEAGLERMRIKPCPSRSLNTVQFGQIRSSRRFCFRIAWVISLNPWNPWSWLSFKTKEAEAIRRGLALPAETNFAGRRCGCRTNRRRSLLPDCCWPWPVRSRRH